MNDYASNLLKEDAGFKRKWEECECNGLIINDSSIVWLLGDGLGNSFFCFSIFERDKLSRKKQGFGLPNPNSTLKFDRGLLLLP